MLSYQAHIQNPAKHINSERFLAVNYFRKTLHRRCWQCSECTSRLLLYLLVVRLKLKSVITLARIAWYLVDFLLSRCFWLIFTAKTVNYKWYDIHFSKKISEWYAKNSSALIKLVQYHFVTQCISWYLFW